MPQRIPIRRECHRILSIYHAMTINELMLSLRRGFTTRRRPRLVSDARAAEQSAQYIFSYYRSMSCRYFHFAALVAPRLCALDDSRFSGSLATYYMVNCTIFLVNRLCRMKCRHDTQARTASCQVRNVAICACGSIIIISSSEESTRHGVGGATRLGARKCYRLRASSLYFAC